MAKKKDEPTPARGRAARAAAKASAEPKPKRRQQLMEAYRITKRSDPKIGLKMLGAGVVAFLVGFAVFVLLPGSGVVQWVMAVIGGLLFGSLAALIVLSRRAQSSAYDQIEGQPGAAAAALGMLRRGWKMEPTVAFNRQQDVVHRVVGPPGIVLVGEGNHTRVRGLMLAERRKYERVTSGTTVTEIHCGRGEGEVPLPDLVKHLNKMSRKSKAPLRGADMTDVLQRLKALDATRSNIPLPKGPVPTNMKGMRSQMRGR